MDFNFNVERYSWSEGFLRSLIWVGGITVALILFVPFIIGFVGTEEGMTIVQNYNWLFNSIVNLKYEARIGMIAWLLLYLTVAILIKTRES